MSGTSLKEVQVFLGYNVWMGTEVRQHIKQLVFEIGQLPTVPLLHGGVCVFTLEAQSTVCTKWQAPHLFHVTIYNTTAGFPCRRIATRERPASGILAPRALPPRQGIVGIGAGLGQWALHAIVKVTWELYAVGLTRTPIV